MDFIDQLYDILGMNTAETPVYFKIVVPIVLLFFVIVLPIYIYNTLKSIVHGTRGVVKGAVNITSGIVSLARGVRVKNDGTLTTEQIRRIAVGAMYANQQGGYVDALRMDVNSTRLDTVLVGWWGINGREEALETLQYLSQGPYGMVFPAIYKAFTTDGVVEQKAVIAETCGGDDELFNDNWGKLMNLKRSYNELVDSGVVKDKADMQRLGVAGWDAGRLNFIARACLDKGYIGEDECWKYVNHAYDIAHVSLSSWRDLSNSYMLGRAIWNGDVYMVGHAEDLLEKPESPWVAVSF